MQTTLDQIDARQTQLQADTLSPYTTLARQIADDHEVDIDEAARVIEAAGLTRADLEKDVSAIKQRKELRLRFDKWSNSRKRLGEVDQLIRRKQAEFDEATRRHQEEMAPLVTESRQLNGLIDDARSAEKRLRLSVVDRSLEPRREQLSQRRKPLGDRSRKLGEDLLETYQGTPAFALAHARKALLTAEQDLEKAKGDEIAERIRLAEQELASTKQRLEQRIETVDRIKAAKAEVDQELAAVNRDIESLRAEELVP